MGRLIEAQDVRSLPVPLVLDVGDVLRCHAFGGRIVSASSSGATNPVRLLGPFVEAVVGIAGQLVSPYGPPNSLLIAAQAPGQTSVSLNVGDPWGQFDEVTVDIVVQAANITDPLANDLLS
jgi:hypothetical protein